MIDRMGGGVLYLFTSGDSKVKNIVLYVHGKGGNPEEAEHYVSLFPHASVVGLSYLSQTPWEAKREFPLLFDRLTLGYDSVTLIANSIGAFFSLYALSNQSIQKAYFISPIVNMEKLIEKMMTWANVREEDLRRCGEIPTEFGETLSWEYLCYVRQHSLHWSIPTAVLYGEKDHLTSPETITTFTDTVGASLTVMKQGEHWFHTEEQMRFLDAWLQSELAESRLPIVSAEACE